MSNLIRVKMQRDITQCNTISTRKLKRKELCIYTKLTKFRQQSVQPTVFILQPFHGYISVIIIMGHVHGLGQMCLNDQLNFTDNIGN